MQIDKVGIKCIKYAGMKKAQTLFRLFPFSPIRPEIFAIPT